VVFDIKVCYSKPQKWKCNILQRDWAVMRNICLFEKNLIRFDFHWPWSMKGNRCKM